MAKAKVLTEEEVKRVFTMAKTTRYGERNKLLLTLSIFAGMRAGEIASLNIGNLASEDGTVRDRINLNTNQTKGKKGRTVLLSTKVQSAVKQFISKTNIDPSKQDKALIESQFGGNFTANSIVTLFRRLYDLAGIVDARSHSGRRGYITSLASQGVSVRVIQTLAGHSNISVTQGYIDVNESMLSNAVELV